MACVLTSGRTEPCSDAVGGLKAIYLIDYASPSFTVTSGEATAIDAGVTACYKYDLLADGNTFSEPFTQDINAGTSVYEQSLTVALKKQTLASAQELALVVKSRPIVVVRDRMDNYKIMGITDGTACTGDIVSGGTKAEFNGYNITFTATEVAPAAFLDAATVTAFELLVSGTNVTP
jgi:hypothetical protein